MAMTTQAKILSFKVVAGSQVAPPNAQDTVWRLMREHTAARKAWSEAVRVEFASEGNVPAEKFERLQAATSDASDILFEVGRALLTTRPTTLKGAIAVLRYVAAQADDGDDGGATPTYLPEEVNGAFWSIAFFDTIADALITIHGTSS